MSKPLPPTDSPSENPLLSPSGLPHGAPPLDKVKAEHFLPALRLGIAEARAELDTIINNPGKPTFENTIEALEFMGAAMNRVSTIFGNLTSANTSDALRAIEDEMNAEEVRFRSDLSLDPALFIRVKAVYDARQTLSLTQEQKMLVEETYRSFERSGALLDDDGKARLREINERLSALATAYRNNSVSSVASYKKIIDDEAALAGIPERAKGNYRAAAESEGLDGKWVIRLSPPPVDVLEYAESRALREEIFRAQSSVAWRDKNSAKDAFNAPGAAPDNGPVVMEMVKLRHEKALLLGFDNYAAFVLDDRMAKTPETVMDFLAENKKVYHPAAEEHLQKLKDYALKTDGLSDLQPWDVLYYNRRLKEETFQLNLEDIRPYFNLDKVLEGLRQHAEKLFSIEMTETKGRYPVYDPDVRVYEVKDKASGEMIGLFYADYFARPGAKSGGAWMNTFRNRGLEDGENQFAFVVNVCNFAKPAAGEPCFLSMDEIRTVFHEFGHGLHALLAKGDYKSLTGTNVKWDFVELPSQLQENWAKTKEVLDTFAKHHVTKQPLGDEVIRKINEMENFDAGYFGMRQTYMALLDMTWHTTDPAKIGGVESLEDKVIAENWLFPRPAGPLSNNFGHLFAGGYAAGYYSYKWAEVLEADIFEVFQKKGLYDKDESVKLRNTIYAKGGTEDPNRLFEDMMGRKPDQGALFRREGLAPPQADASKKNPSKAKPPQP